MENNTNYSYAENNDSNQDNIYKPVKLKSTIKEVDKNQDLVVNENEFGKPLNFDECAKITNAKNISEKSLETESSFNLNTNAPLVKPKPSKIIFKRANSLFVSTQNRILNDQTTSSKLYSEEEQVPELIKQPLKQKKSSQGRSLSNEITVSTRDLDDFIRQQSNDYDGDENLTNLAKVILIEHKRSLQLTNTQDSSISSTIFTPTESTSRRDSV